MPKRKDAPADVAPLAYTIAEVVAKTRLGERTIYKHIYEGRLTARKCGKRTLVLADDLNAFLRSMPCIPPKRNAAAY
jgi:excisionase family DNA binding protein